jgi:hypothetical protein
MKRKKKYNGEGLRKKTPPINFFPLTSERENDPRSSSEIEKELSVALVEHVYPLVLELFSSSEGDPDRYLSLINLRFHLNGLSTYCLKLLLENGIGDTSSETLIQQLVAFQTNLGSFTSIQL